MNDNNPFDLSRFLHASEIFGYPDDLKLKSSMTLFGCVPNAPSVFVRVRDKYFFGERDVKTLALFAKTARMTRQRSVYGSKESMARD